MRLGIATVVTLSLSSSVLTAPSPDPLKVSLAVNEGDTVPYPLRNAVHTTTTTSSPVITPVVGLVAIMAIGENANDNAIRVVYNDSKPFKNSAYIHHCYFHTGHIPSTTRLTHNPL